MSAAAFLPERESLKSLRTAAARCRGCALHGPATQTVFGEGLKRARLMQQIGPDQDAFFGTWAREILPRFD